MKNFKDICKLSQRQLKAYMESYLINNDYDVINEDGFLYAKGDIPVLLIAHMDTVHRNLCTTIHDNKGRLSSPQGIGGDDRCGIFIIMNLVKDFKCSVLLCEDEEIGGIGARKFTRTEYIDDLDVNYMVEFDRKGNNDAVFYSCDNKEFTKFITETTGFKEQYGTFSDISVVAPAAKIAAVNLSSGYYNAHTKDEYVEYKEMLDIIATAKTLLATESDAFEYVRKTYNYDYSYNNRNWSKYYNSNYDYNSYNKNRQLTFGGYGQDFSICLEVVWEDEEGSEMVAEASGNTKAEAWANFFMENSDVCFDMILDYSFC